MTGRTKADGPLWAITHDTADWLDQAGCRDMPGQFDQPWPKTTDAELRDWATPLLAICAQCPFTGPSGLCDRRVAPHESGYDGIAAGQVWRKGKRVRVPDPPAPRRNGPEPVQPCGTRAAYRRHERAGEVPCADCREAYNAAARARRMVVAS